MNSRMMKAFMRYENGLRHVSRAIGEIEALYPAFNELTDKENGWTLRMHLNHNNYISVKQAIAVANEILKENNRPPLT